MTRREANQLLNKYFEGKSCRISSINYIIFDSKVHNNSRRWFEVIISSMEEAQKNADYICKLFRKLSDLQVCINVKHSYTVYSCKFFRYKTCSISEIHRSRRLEGKARFYKEETNKIKLFQN